MGCIEGIIPSKLPCFLYVKAMEQQLWQIPNPVNIWRELNLYPQNEILRTPLKMNPVISYYQLTGLVRFKLRRLQNKRQQKSTTSD